MRPLPFFLCAFVVGCSSSSGVTPFDGPYGSPGLDGSSGSAGSGGTSTGVFIAGQDGGAGSTSGLMFSFVTSSGASVVTTSGESVATTTTTQGGQTTQVVSTSTTTQGGQTSHTTTTTVASSTSTTSSAPTWTDLYENYLKVGNTPGQCDSSCHDHTQCDSASDCYRWIGKGEEGALTPQGSGKKLFSWDNGFMPRNGPSSEPQADADFEAWIAAGSLNN